MKRVFRAWKLREFKTEESLRHSVERNCHWACTQCHAQLDFAPRWSDRARPRSVRVQPGMNEASVFVLCDRCKRVHNASVRVWIHNPDMPNPMLVAEA